MKIIIDPYRGGSDTGKEINGKYEKNILLNISKYMSEKLNELGISSELVRTNDISLTDEERNSIINEIKDKNDIIIQNKLSEDGEFDIIYPLRNSDKLPTLIAKDLQSNGISVDKYYQRRLPTNTTLDYYSIIRNTNPNETIIIEYLDNSNYEDIIDIIVNTLNNYVKKKNTYIVQKGDSLYQIATKYNTTVDKLKQLNNLTSNNLSIGQVLKIPVEESDKIEEVPKENTYTVKKGDSLYSIAKNYNITLEEYDDDEIIKCKKNTMKIYKLIYSCIKNLFLVYSSCLQDFMDVNNDSILSERLLVIKYHNSLKYSLYYYHKK